MPKASLSPPSISESSRSAVARPYPAAATERRESRKMAPPATLSRPLSPPALVDPQSPASPPRHPITVPPRSSELGHTDLAIFDRCHCHGPELARHPGPQLQRARLRSAARHRHVPSPRHLPRVPRSRATLPRRPRHRVPVRARTRLTRRAVPAHPEHTRLASARIRTEST
jgi:hypothetical protein